LAENQRKWSVAAACDLLRKHLSGKKPSVYQVLGYFAWRNGSLRNSNLLEIATVMHREKKAGRALFVGNPKDVRPLFVVRSNELSWAESLLNSLIYSRGNEALSTSELAHQADIGRSKKAISYANTGLNFLQASGLVTRLPNKGTGKTPEAMWLLRGRPVKIDYPNIFVDILSILSQNGGASPLTGLHRPKRFVRGPSRVEHIGNSSAQFARNAVVSAVTVLLNGGVVVRENVVSARRSRNNRRITHFLLKFTSDGKSLWDEYVRTGNLPPKLVSLFVNRSV
jgi:hypothetical protein